MSTSKEITFSGNQVLIVADALNATTVKLLQLLSYEKLDITTMSKKTGLSEAYISEQVRHLEGLKLVNISYERGKRGIRKICELSFNKIVLNIVDEPSSP